MKLILTSFVAMLLAVGVSAQSPPPKAAAASKAVSGVDTVIALVKGGMSEALVIRTLKREGKTYTLSTTDLLKLQKAGISENIIEVMTDPGAAGGGAVAAPAASPRAASGGAAAEATGASSSYPPDLPDIPAVRKRRVAIKPFD
ncbi:MAG: hypothetical protein ABUS56_00320, partial [Acidobacteriota bacterium]